MQLRFSPERKRLLIIIGSLLVAIGFIALAIIDTYRAVDSYQHGNATTTITKDPTSGESFIHQDGVVPESQVNKTNTPIFAGFGILIDRGLTSDQVDALQKAFQLYKPFANSSIKISLDINDIHKDSPKNDDPLGRWSIITSLVINQQTTYHVTFFYWGTSTVQLLLYDASGKTLLLDSGTVTS